MMAETWPVTDTETSADRIARIEDWVARYRAIRMEGLTLLQGLPRPESRDESFAALALGSLLMGHRPLRTRRSGSGKGHGE